MGHGNAGGQVGVEKKLFHRHLLRLKGVNQLLHISVDLAQPPGQGQPCRGGDHPIADQGVFLPGGLNDPEAYGGNTGVNPQNAHEHPPQSYVCTIVAYALPVDNP